MLYLCSFDIDLVPRVVYTMFDTKVAIKLRVMSIKKEKTERGCDASHPRSQRTNSTFIDLDPPVKIPKQYY